MNFSPRRLIARLGRGVSGLLAVLVVFQVALLCLRGFAPDIFDAAIVHVALVPDRILGFEIQGLVSGLLVHDPESIFHLLLDSAVLYSLGPLVERALGTRRFLFMYLTAGLAGSVAQAAWVLVAGDPASMTMTASGPVLGVVLAFSLLFPDARLRLWLLAPMSARHLVWLAVALDVVAVVADPRVAVASHAGGMAASYLFLKRPWQRFGRRAGRVRIVHREEWN